MKDVSTRQAAVSFAAMVVALAGVAYLVKFFAA